MAERRSPRLKGENKKKKGYTSEEYPKSWEYPDEPGIKHNNKQCVSCKYGTGLKEDAKYTGKVTCDYLEKTGKRRGCKPAPNCEKYEKKDKKKTRSKFNPAGKNINERREPQYVYLGKKYSK